MIGLQFLFLFPAYSARILVKQRRWDEMEGSVRKEGVRDHAKEITFLPKNVKQSNNFRLIDSGRCQSFNNGWVSGNGARLAAV
jgi:hypothetical protein